MNSRFYAACLCLVIVLLGSCLNKTGKDLHPEIPEFPAITHKQLVVKKLFDQVSDYYYNDSVLICRDSAAMIVYHFRDQQPKRFPTTEFRYANGLFILKEGEHYFTVDDRSFDKHTVDIINESGRLKEIEDSVYKLYADSTSSYKSIVDSLFIDYFYSKYQLDKNSIPFNHQVGADDYYIKTTNSELILIQIPESLEQKISPAIVRESQEPAPAANALQMVGDLKEQHPHIKETGYAMMRKAWHVPGGGNHFIPAIPVYGEVGYYYYEMALGEIQGKFKILNGQDGLIEFRINDRSLLVIDRDVVYIIYVK